MPNNTIALEAPLVWQQVNSVAGGARLSLSAAASQRIVRAHSIKQAIVAKSIRAYGVNTGVGALCDVIVSPALQQQLSQNLVMSHAVGMGDPLDRVQTRAIMAAAINNHALGFSGIRLQVTQAMAALLAQDCIPAVPAKGSVGYLSHMAHVALVLTGHGKAVVNGETMAGSDALARAGVAPLVLEAKEGLSLINGTPCATGLACVALARVQRLLAWADAIAALSVEALRASPASFDPRTLALRPSPGLLATGQRLSALLEGSGLTARTGESRTQEALSMRAIPHVHGAAKDCFDTTAEVVNRELASVTDNPVLTGTPDEPQVHSQAHAVGAALALAMDTLAVAVAQVAAMSERRLDRLVNPLVSGLPPFLAMAAGVGSGFMIAQYAALSLVTENRRLAAPASLDGGITSALQEDFVPHSTPAALKALAVTENAERVLAIEYLAAAQAHGFHDAARAPGTERIYHTIRDLLPPYADDRPLSDDMEAAWALIRDRDFSPGP